METELAGRCRIIYPRSSPGGLQAWNFRVLDADTMEDIGARALRLHMDIDTRQDFVTAELTVLADADGHSTDRPQRDESGNVRTTVLTYRVAEFVEQP